MSNPIVSHRASVTAPARKIDRRADDRMNRILAAIKAEPLTADELSAKLFISKSPMMRYLRRLRTSPRRIRIGEYRQTATSWAFIYSIGTEPDAPRPVQLTRHERWLREKAAMKADDERRDRGLSRRRGQKRAREAVKNPNGWAAPLLGTIAQAGPTC